MALTRRTRVLAVLVVAVLGLAGAPAASAEPGVDEAAFVAKINDLRASKGLGPLVVDAELTAIARRWAAQMAAAGDISHNPGFSREATADWAKLGENVGMGPDLDSLFTAFVNSPRHYANLVDPVFTRVGVGVVVARGTIFTAHQFEALRTPAPAPPTTLPPPATSTTALPVATAPSVPTTAPESVPAPAVPLSPSPTPSPTPSPRLVSVLQQLRELDPTA